jgi:hypothetical protein
MVRGACFDSWDFFPKLGVRARITGWGPIPKTASKKGRPKGCCRPGPGNRVRCKGSTPGASRPQALGDSRLSAPHCRLSLGPESGPAEVKVNDNSDSGMTDNNSSTSYIAGSHCGGQRKAEEWS